MFGSFSAAILLKLFVICPSVLLKNKNVLPLRRQYFSRDCLFQQGPHFTDPAVLHVAASFPPVVQRVKSESQSTFSPIDFTLLRPEPGR